MREKEASPMAVQMWFNRSMKHGSEKLCITFAGVIGSSKTPIAHYLSVEFGLPVLSADAIRTEVNEDKGKFDEQEAKRIVEKRLETILEKSNSFIYDASVDRDWPQVKELLLRYGYSWFIVSLDLSKHFLLQLYERKQYFMEHPADSLRRLDDLLKDHDSFLMKYEEDVGLHISEKEFSRRLELAREALLE